MLALLPQRYERTGAPLESLRRIKTSPITGVHLWFDRPVMNEPFLTLLDHTTQWIFNKSLLSANLKPTARMPRPMNRAIPEVESGQYLQLVDQRVVRSGSAFAAGDYRPLPARAARGACRRRAKRNSERPR